MQSSAATRGKSRSLLIDDIQGAKPKMYGGTGNSNIVNFCAGVSSGMQARLKEAEAPWGAGGNFDSTSYGAKWLEKTDK